MIVTDEEDMALPDVPHEVPVARLPRAGRMTLSLLVGNELGHGRVGRVYEAEVDRSTSHLALENMVLPPLVVKISRRDRASALLPEAQNYVDMQIIQGAVIPRCYGVFTATAPADCQFSPWDEDGLDARDSTPEDFIDHNLIKDTLPEGTVSILVLEHVGGCIPVRKYAEDEQYVITSFDAAAIYGLTCLAASYTRCIRT